jgi:hypothetical protein
MEKYVGENKPDHGTECFGCHNKNVEICFLLSSHIQAGMALTYDPTAAIQNG